ncbi:MAG: sugar ABC transporter permease [Lachnospiraceae bacterium]|nr:sugar ABC transporter permease [Lachnospiraceae bacterium]
MSVALFCKLKEKGEVKVAKSTQPRSKVLARQETFTAYMFLIPSLFFFITFVIVPMVMCVFNSFFDYTSTSFNFIGFGNYVRMFQDEIFMRALKNTILIVVVSVPAVVIFSLWVASAIYKMSNFALSFYRCVFYLPVVTGSVAVTVVWKWMFNKYTGLFNYVLNSAGLIEENISWLGDERFAIWCIIIILFTTSIGQPIVLYVSALGNVDKTLVEAAQVDGATDLQTFWKIKWPSIMPTTLYVLVITTINSFQCFALIELLTSGGPNNSTQTIMYYIYYVVFKLDQFGYGNAMGVILAIIIALFSALQFKLGSEN